MFVSVIFISTFHLLLRRAIDYCRFALSPLFKAIPRAKPYGNDSDLPDNIMNVQKNQIFI